MAYLVRRRGDHPAFLPGAFPPGMSLSSNWREDEIRDLLAGDTGVDRYKKLLLRFGPFNNESASIMGIAPCPDIPTLYGHFFSYNDINPTDIIPAVCDESIRLFRQIPFHSWVRLALGLEDEALQFFKRFHETLNYHILTYQEHHRNELPVLYCVSEV
jgi:hypothetical protein